MTIGRRFRYPLEALRQLREWRLQSAQSRASALQVELGFHESRLGQLETEYAREAGVAMQSWQRTGDPVSKTGSLAWLTRRQNDAHVIREEVSRVRAALAAAREECAVCERDLEILHKHRDDERNRHRLAFDRHEAAHADAEWCARLYRTGGAS